MKRSRRNYGLYISVGALALAIIGSGLFYKREADKAKRLEGEITRWREQLNTLRIETPTKEHLQHLEKQKTEIEENFKGIVREVLRWNYVPEEMDGLRFQGNMLATIRMVTAAAQANQIMIGPRAKYLGFDQYAASPPPDEEVPQLQKEFSAAVDIAQLLILSDVYSIDRMSRRHEACMEEGRTTTALMIPGDIPLTTKRKKAKYEFYDTVPLRVQFSCTYPSLAFFQKSLISAEKIEAGSEGLPRNFLVVNDLRFKVKGVETEREKILGSALERARTAAWAAAMGRGPGVPEFPEDLEDAQLMWERDREGARRFFAQWRTWLPEQKEIYRLNKRLREQLSDDIKQELAARRDRLVKELEYRKLPGRPPEYSLIEVNMLIDLVQFFDKSQGTRKALVEELEPGAPKGRGSGSSISTAER